MKRYHIFRDGTMIAAMETREEALEYIRIKQARETHYIKPSFSIIYGEEEFIGYNIGV